MVERMLRSAVPGSFAQGAWPAATRMARVFCSRSTITSNCLMSNSFHDTLLRTKTTGSPGRTPWRPLASGDRSNIEAPCEEGQVKFRRNCVFPATLLYFVVYRRVRRDRVRRDRSKFPRNCVFLITLSSFVVYSLAIHEISARQG